MESGRGIIVRVMEQALEAAVLGRLERVGLAEPAADLLLASLDGEKELRKAVGGQLTHRPKQAVAADNGTHAQAVRAYLRSVTVEGFRGIGPAATLDLQPGPGLTVVCGRNGSGKSSFAEGLEVLLTGKLRRWENRSAVWRDGWRCLHARQARLRAELLVEGTSGVTVVERSWSEDAMALTASTAWAQEPARQRGTVEDLGWAQALSSYRPFLSHSELESLLAEPKNLHDQLNALLGLDALEAAAKLLAGARRDCDSQVRAAKDLRAELEAALGASEDERAVSALALLRAGTADVEALAHLSEGTGTAAGAHGVLTQLGALTVPDGADVDGAAAGLRTAADILEAATSAAAEHAGSVAEMLELALAHYGRHGPGDCPVCQAPGALDGAWEASASSRLEGYKELGQGVATARRSAAAAVAAARALLVAVPPSLVRAGETGLDAGPALEAWRAWSALVVGDGKPGAMRALADAMGTAYPVLAEAVARLAGAAGDEVRSREGRWAPLAERLAQYCRATAGTDKAKALASSLKDAEKWLKGANDELRDEQVRPFADRTVALWAELRQESNVELLRMRLAGAGNHSHVEFEVAVDGKDAAGLGVMSQGEVNALALSVFLPRATSERSPLRFVVIDDPVQAMDPAKVAGLARVLAEAGKTRQVVVFTHDDRLPAAVRDLQLPARISQVQRRAGSVVEVVAVSDPVSLLLADAARLVAADHLSRAVTSRVVPGICRTALETACNEVTRRRRLANGSGHGQLEEELLAARRLLPRLALALFDDPSKGGEVYSWLNARVGPWAADAVRACNEGAHAGGANPANLVGDVKRLVERVRALAT